MFLLVSAYPGCPGSKAVKRSLLLLLLFSITHSLFHSRLKTFLFCKSFPRQPFFFFFRTDCMIPQTLTVTSEHIRFYFSVFLFYTF